MSVKFTFGGTDARVIAWLHGKGQTIVAAIASRLTLLMLKLEQHIVRDKLSGQVLQRRTGKLGGSIHAMPTEAQGTTLIGQVVGASGPAWYGRVHEYGGKAAYDIFPIRGKALAFFPQGYSQVSGGRQILRGMKQTTNLQRRSKAIIDFGAAGGVVVKSVHHPPLPMRAFMRPASAEMREQIVQELQAAASTAAARD